MEIILTIKIDSDEIFKAIANHDFNEFRVKLNKVAKEYHNQKPQGKEHDEPVKKSLPQSSKTSESLPNKIIYGTCFKCGKQFIRSGPRQLYCSFECGLKKKWVNKSNPEPIDKTLEEIDKTRAERESKPYIFQH